MRKEIITEIIINMIDIPTADARKKTPLKKQNNPIFSIFNSLVIIFWGFLIFIPKNKFTKEIVNYPYIPIIFSFGYLFFLVQVPDIFKADFSSLDGVLSLFKNSTLESAAAGWIHYLAFDFWMGAWILKNSQKNDVFINIE